MHIARMTLAAAMTFTGVTLALLVLLAGPARAAEIVLTAEGFSPNPATVPVGEPVEFVNELSMTVQIIDDDGRWNSGLLASGASFTITFDEPGEMTFATVDGAFAGVLVVDGVDAEATAEPTAPPTPDADGSTAEPVPDPTMDAEPATELPTAEPPVDATPEDGPTDDGPTEDPTPEETTPSPAPDGPPDGDDADPPEELAETGADVRLLIATAVLLVVAGAAVLRRAG